MEKSRRKLELQTSLLKGIWIYALILWAYIVLDTFLFPSFQFLGISKFIPIPQNLLADIAFPLSFLSFVWWDYLRKQK